MAQQIDLLYTEMRAQSLDIVDQPITSIAGRVRRYRRFAGSAQVEQHQRAMRGQPAQVAEVGRGLHGTAGKADQRVTVADLVICKPRAVGTVDSSHFGIICRAISTPLSRAKA